MTSKELISKLNNVEEGRSVYLQEYDAYIACVNGFRGIAIECDEDVMILEKFNKVEISTVLLNIKSKIIKAVYLHTKDIEMSQNYGEFCLNFLSINNRDIIKHNPIDWFDSWRDLLGNTKTNKMIFDIIGELKVLLIMQKAKKNPIWNSTNMGTFDITTDDAVYEVKSTINKTKSYITIHNQYQLNYEELDKKLYIAFVRLEQNDAGESIDNLYNELIENGFSKDVLDEYLKSIGYYEGKQERYTKYIIHSVERYLVDENFPRITINSFKNDTIPNGVVKYEYTISLDNIENNSLI